MPLKSIPRRCGRKTLAFFLLLLTLGSSTAPAQTLIKVGIYHNPPLVFMDEKGIPQGVYVDTLNAIAKQENWTLEYVYAQWVDLLEKAKKGDIDLLTAIAYSPERDAWLDFNREAFAERWGVVYAPAGAAIRAMADLNGKQVALARKDIHADYFRQAAEAMGLELTLMEVVGYEAMLKAVRDRKVEACVVSNGFGNANAHRYRLEATPLAFKPTPLGVAFPQGKHSGIAGSLDAYLGRWKNEPDSEYLASYKRWLGAPRWQKKPLALTPEEHAWLKAHPAVSVAFDGYFPPYSYLTAEGKVEGFAVDVLNRLAGRIGIRIDIHPVYLWKDLYDAAVRKEVDVVATMVQRPDREQWFSFTKPYVYKSLVIMTRADDASIREREDIAGKRVALVRGYQYVPRIISDFPTLKPYYVDTMLDGLNAMATGNTDAAVTFFSAGRYLQTTYGIPDLKFAAVYDRSSSLESFAVRKDWPELAALLDKALLDMDQAELQALQRKWNSDEMLLAELQEDFLSHGEKIWLFGLAAAAGLALFAFFGVWAWNRTLKNQVALKTHALEIELDESARMAKALGESEEKFRTLVEQSPLGFAWLDSKGRYKYTSPRFKDLFGYAPEEIPTGSEWFKKAFPDPQLRDEALKAWIKDRRQAVVGQARPRAFTVTCKDGSCKEIQFVPVTLKNQDQFVIYEDITERRRGEEERERLRNQLQQSQKMEAIGTLAGGIAHDFNNMLSVIMGYAELARERVEDPGRPSARALDEILNASRRAAELVKQLLGFARKQTVQPSVLDLNQKLESSRRMLERLIGEDINLELVKSPDLGTLLMDPSQIDQILTNLAANARDVIQDVGSITIATENVVLDEAHCSRHPECIPGPYVLLRFSDTGTGMDEKTKGKIFEPFFTTKEVGKGTGMGLAMVYGIVKQNGGYVEVESEQGLGTTFRIGFPRYKGEAAPTEDLAPEAFKKGEEVVLIVEDEAEILNLAQKILERQGYRVVTARLPDQAIALCETQEVEIHLLITDIIMPTMNGKDLSDRIRRLKPKIKTLFMSGYPKDLIAQRGILTEEVCFLEKPFSLKTLTDKVREVLDS